MNELTIKAAITAGDIDPLELLFDALEASIRASVGLADGILEETSWKGAQRTGVVSNGIRADTEIVGSKEGSIEASSDGTLENETVGITLR